MIPLLVVLTVQMAVCCLVVIARRGAVPDRKSEGVALGLMGLPFLAAGLLAAMPLPVGPVWEGALPALLPHGLPPDGAAHVAPQPLALPAITLPVLMALYAGPALVRLGRLGAGMIRLRRIERGARPAPSLGPDVFVSPCVPSPFASARGIFLPDAVAADPDAMLVVLHERQHRAAGDPLLFLGLSVLDALFWGHPFIRWQTARYRLAAELTCDAAVTAAVPQKRRAYAALLLRVARKPAGSALASVPAVISQTAVGDITMRLSFILTPSRRRGKRRFRLALPALALIPALGLQAVALGQSASDPLSVFPVEGRLTSGYGERVHPISKKTILHRGIDIAAPRGTPIRAAGGGEVILAEVKGGHGLMVAIDHGAGLVTRYGQLDSMAVAVGDRVAAGTVIGAVGSSGQGTGPHLHFEVIEAGKSVNPALRVPMPS